MTHTYTRDGVTYTDDAALADALVREHLDCPNIDTQSLTFGCYSHAAYVGVRYEG